MLCKYCGNELPEGSNYCDACGKKQDTTLSQPSNQIPNSSFPNCQSQMGNSQNPYQQYNQNKTNSMAIAGFILAFFIPIAGLILSILGYQQIQKSGEKGMGLAKAGVILSGIFMILNVLLAITCN